MIEKMEMGEILKPLEERFKKFSNDDQARIYLKRLQHLEPDPLKRAVEHLVDHAKAFPTPGEIKGAYREMNHGKVAPQVKGCSSCVNGWVYYTRPVYGREHAPDGWIGEFAAPCALCLSEHEIPQVIMKESDIYRASRNIGKDKPWHVSDLNHPELIEGAYPGNRFLRARAGIDG